MVDEYQLNENKQKEAEYQQKANNKQAEIDHINNLNEQRKLQPPTDNIFAKMKDMFERKSAQGELRKRTLEYEKRQHEDEAWHKKQSIVILEKERDTQNKLDNETYHQEDKMGRIKQKINMFTTNLSGFANNPKLLKMSDKFLGSYQNKTTTSSGLPSGDRIRQFTGGTQHLQTHLGRVKPNTHKLTSTHLKQNFKPININKFLGTKKGKKDKDIRRIIGI